MPSWMGDGVSTPVPGSVVVDGGAAELVVEGSGSSGGIPQFLSTQ